MSTNPLLGTWHLERWVITYADGRKPSYPFGEDVQGLLVYTHDGTMSGIIARQGRARMSSESAKTAPQPEQLAAFQSYFSYAGTYEIEGDDVIHHVTQALFPNLVGTDQRRRMRFEGDGLELTAEDTVPERAARLVNTAAELVRLRFRRRALQL